MECGILMVKIWSLEPPTSGFDALDDVVITASDVAITASDVASNCK